MIKRFCSHILLLFLFPFLCASQAYKSIGIEDGLSSKKVYTIRKDKTGFMWFLTHSGIDRYDGRIFKHYTLTIDTVEVSSQQYLNWLYTDSNGKLWQISKRGFVFSYNTIPDRFELIYKLPEEERNNTVLPVSYSFIDNKDNIWLCGNGNIYLYNTVRGEAKRYETDIPGNITYICQCKDDNYYIGTDNGIYIAVLQNDSLEFITQPLINDTPLMVNNLYYDDHTNQLFIGTFLSGLYIFDLAENKFIDTPENTFADLTITRIASLNEDELLLATNGAGIYKLNTTTLQTSPYIIADYTRNNSIGNNITDFYIDSTGKIWIADYPHGITVRDDRYSFYKVYSQSTGNEQSLINNTVNHVIEDSEGDLWFATDNGICFYNDQSGQWHSFFSSFDSSYQDKNHVFLSICEYSPGIFYVGGYGSKLYQIDKSTLKTKPLLNINPPTGSNTKPDKYIRSIIKASDNTLWAGGYYNLKSVDISSNKVTYYPDFNNITVLLEKDNKSIWIGTSAGLYLLDKENGYHKNIELPVLSSYIYSLYQSDDQKLYIGTNGSGLLIYDIAQDSFEHFNKENSSLISNNIYTILANNDTIIVSSNSGLTRLNYPEKNDFHNWTKEQGLITNQFSANSGIVRKNGNFVFGSTDGAIELDKDIVIPHIHPSRTVLSELHIYNNDGEIVPYEKNINETKQLILGHDQNILSIRVSAINYDYPSDILYSWKMEGLNETWNIPVSTGIINYTNLNPGKYILRIRTISNESSKIIEQRDISITIKPPFWGNPWFTLVYLSLFIAGIFLISRNYYKRKQRKASDEKLEFFINTAHDIRTPLTLVKAPLDEIVSTEQLSPEATRNINTALRNVNVLLRLTNNLINFQHTDVYSSDVFIAEHELSSLLNEIIKSFQSYASVKEITLTCKSNFKYLNVWFDKEKMDSIIRNIISNALKYTPNGGSVSVYAYDSAGYWNIIVKDTGIGIPISEQKRMFKDHFRGSNTINSKITGSGIGMVLVGRLIKLHKGKITLESVEHEGTTIKISFPKGYDHFKKAHLAMPYKNESVADEQLIVPVPNADPVKLNSNGKRILVVEDNDELRRYLQQTLGDKYHVQTCENAQDALLIVKDYMPELIISDIMMPGIRGDEMCEQIKKDIETSHIPIILLTALNDDKNILKGIGTGADEYILKPFNIGILKATIANLLDNRARLKKKFAKLDLTRSEDENGTKAKCISDLDWKFISNVKKIVEQNMSNTDFNVDSLCYHMNMSRTSLYNKVKVLTDSAPSDFMRIIRLNKAADYMKDGKHSVTEVAEMTGFGDAKYFREVFKKHFEVSPSKYKDKDKLVK